LSAEYYAELETCQRLAPPRRTALRIAKALQLSELQASHLTSLAAAERAAALLDAHLPANVRQLVLMIRRAAPRLSEETVDAMLAKLNEAPM
jgi:hypothetical protein